MPPATYAPHGIEFVSSKRRAATTDEYAPGSFFPTLAPAAPASLDGFVNGTVAPRLVVARGLRHIAPDAAVAGSAAEGSRAEARRAAGEGARRAALSAAINRNGFNPVTNEQTGPVALDTFRPRATREPPPQSDYLKWETAARSRDDLRFHRLLDPSDAGLQARSQLLLDAGLPGLAGRRKSSAIGYGRAELPSRGAADAFAYAEYGGTAWAAPADAPPGVAESRRPGAAPRGGDDGDAAAAAARFEAEAAARRLAATTRAPNRVFDVASAPVILVTKPDAVAADVRRERELQAARAAAGAPGGAAGAGATGAGARGAGGFTAAAEALAARRGRAVKGAEVRMVEGLRM